MKIRAQLGSSERSEGEGQRSRDKDTSMADTSMQASLEAEVRAGQSSAPPSDPRLMSMRYKT